MSITRASYLPRYFIQNDFIGPLDTFDFHFISAAPQEISGYLALIRIFDPTTWAFVFASGVAVVIVLVTTTKMQETWLNTASKESVYEGTMLPDMTHKWRIIPDIDMLDHVLP